MSSRKTKKRRNGLLRRTRDEALAELARLQANARCRRDRRRIDYLARLAGVPLEQMA